ncbi:Glycine-rich domain-containing protein 1, partial [Linum perenne]
MLKLVNFRYNACWLPLLAKHSESPTFDGPLVVPLDCEWIWHCHRLNPVRYSSDCLELYGSVLENSHVVSSVQGTCTKQTEEVWNKLYPDEPFQLDMNKALSPLGANEKPVAVEKCTKHDLVAAVTRQIPFTSQVSGPHMNNLALLENDVAIYKGFLHLIKRNAERSINAFCVPTTDIDLIWHTHQLHPVSYSKDMGCHFKNWVA